MYKPVRLDARDRVVRLGAQGKAEQRLGGAERRLGGSERRLGGAERRLGGAGEAAELCGAAEILGVPLTPPFISRRSFAFICAIAHSYTLQFNHILTFRVHTQAPSHAQMNLNGSSILPRMRV